MFKFGNVFMFFKVFFFSLFLLFFMADKVSAFNNSDIDENDVGFSIIMSGYIDFMRYDQVKANRMYVTLNQGEKFKFGINPYVTNNNDAGIALTTKTFVRIKDDAGAVVWGPQEILAGNGLINNRGEALAGPKSLNVNGYDELTFDAPLDGDYYLEVNYEDPNNFTPVSSMP